MRLDPIVVQIEQAKAPIFHAELEATSLCNTRCLHCPHEAISRPGGKMTWETYTVIVDKIRAYVKGQPYSLSYSGMGEPMLNPLIYKFVKHVSGEATTAFSSNGAVLTESNVLKLIDAGLDTIYLSFNGDEAEIYKKMMGGLSFDKVLANVRRAVELARGTRLKVRANVSITKETQDRVTRMDEFLQKEEMGPVSFSLCHDRGGNLNDKAVCDTPALGVENWPCDVMKNTLTVDWQGKVHICEHDLHGQYQLGDLMTEPLDVVLARREALLLDSRALEICKGCNDVMRAGGTPPLDSKAGGLMRDWVYYLFKDMEDPTSEMNEAMKWIFRIYQKEGRADRFANRMVELEKAAQTELERERRERAACEAAIEAERTNRISVQGDRDAIRKEKEGIQRLLDQRDKEFAALHAELVAMRKDKAWRFASMIRRDVGRIFGRTRPKAG
jgi:radical SAM protein with 4Fe4S-binding SPASM domain